MTLLLLAVVVQLTWSVVARLSRGVSTASHRAESLEAERTVWWVLSSETAGAGPGAAVHLAGPGVLELRAFRGRGVACGEVDSTGWLAVSYDGWRSPDPAKDSVLGLDDAGRWTPLRLADRIPDAGACVRTGERAERWRLDPPPPPGLRVLRLFERGSYHLEDDAFRYRRGGGGRQPLTAPLLDPSSSGIERVGAALKLDFRATGPAGGPSPDPGWSRRLPTR